MKVHRTSSSRKVRRKNDGSDWVERSAQFHPLSPFNPYIHPDFSSHKKKGVLQHVLWLWRQLNFSIRFQLQLPHPLTVLFAAFGAFLICVHLTKTFNTSTRFEELNNLEREVSLPTQVARHYSYFKQIAQADSYLQGLRSITRDETNSSANSFQRYSLTPQALLAGGFHATHTFARWTNLGRRVCKEATDPVSGDFLTTVQGVNLEKEKTDINAKKKAHEDWARSGKGASSERTVKDPLSLSCSGLSDPLQFYLGAVRLLESGAIVLVFFLGRELSGCLWGGLSSAALCLLLHPQGWNYDWMFPLPAKIGWACAVLQLSTVSRSVYLPTHPPWSATVKVGLSTALLICCWNTEAQWLLTSQLLIVALVHILGFLSRYRASLIIFGQLTGFQWASLVSLDVSLHYWSLFLYALLATSITLVVVEPIVEWILGKKREKWAFFRKTVLLITLQTILIAVRFDLAQFQHLYEDSRFPLSRDCQLPSLSNYFHHQNPAFQCPSKLNVNVWEEQEQNARGAYNNKLVTVNPYLDKAQRKKSPSYQDNYSINYEGAESVKERFIWSTEREKRNEDGRIWSRVSAVNEFVRRFLTCERKMGIQEFVKKEGWMIVAALYSTFAALFLPRILQSLPKSWKKEDWIEEEEKLYAGGAVEAPQEGSRWSRWWKGVLGEKERDAEWEGVVVYHVIQTGFIGLFCVFVEEGWQFLFFTQLALLISLAARIQGTWKELKQLSWPYARYMHCAILFALISILLATTRMRFNQLNPISRGRFEVGNARVAAAVEGLRWIHQNTHSAVVAGPDNLMVAVDVALSPHTSTINPHLSIHSWANSNPIPKPPPPISEETTTPKSIFLRPSEDIQMSKTSVLTKEEMKRLEVIYSVFSHTQTILTLHEKLLALNVTHLILSPNMCPHPQSTYLIHQQRNVPLTSSSGVKPIKGNNKWLPSDSESHLVVEDATAQREDTGGKEKGRNSIKIEDECTIIGGRKCLGTWQWRGNWQEPENLHTLHTLHTPLQGKNEPLVNSVSTASSIKVCTDCDMIRFWGEMESLERDKRKSREIKESQCEGSEGGDHDGGQRSKGWKREVNIKGSWNTSEEGVSEEEKDEEEEGYEETLCHRLLHERIVLPFQRVFNNDILTIFSLHSSPSNLSPPTPSPSYGKKWQEHSNNKYYNYKHH